MYKRQDYNGREEYDAVLAREVAAFHPDFVALAGFMRVLTVSYTHLDVYKRQVQSCILVTCTPRELDGVLKSAEKAGITAAVLGETGGVHLIIRDQSERVLINQHIEEMEKVWRGSIAGYF